MEGDRQLPPATTSFGPHDTLDAPAGSGGPVIISAAASKPRCDASRRSRERITARGRDRQTAEIHIRIARMNRQARSRGMTSSEKGETAAQDRVLLHRHPALSQSPQDLGFHDRALARFGGYLDPAADAPPRATIIWQGFSRLAELVEGVCIAQPPPGICV